MPATDFQPVMPPNKFDKDDVQIQVSSRQGLRNSVLGTRNLMTVAALAIVGSLFVVPLSYVGGSLAATPQAVLAGASMMGLWVIPYLLPAVIVQRPGATLIAGFILGVIAMFTTPLGPGAIVGNILGALFIEIPLLITVYRFWSKSMFLICATVFGLLNGMLYLSMVKNGLTGVYAVSIVAASVTSALLGAILTIYIRYALNRAGVAMNHPFVKHNRAR